MTQCKVLHTKCSINIMNIKLRSEERMELGCPGVAKIKEGRRGEGKSVFHAEVTAC